MKQYFVSILCTIVLLTFVGCQEKPDDNSIIVDWAPVNLYFYVEDEFGNDIASHYSLNLIFKNIIYNRPYTYARTQTYYMPTMHGLQYQRKNTDENPTDRNRFYFGEINGADDMDEDIIINWSDGSKNTIHYHCSDHRKSPKIDCKREWTLDGEKHDGNTFTFVKDGDYGLIVDWAPVNIYIYAKDSIENDIIQEDMPKISLEFKGEVYHFPSSTERTQTAYMPHMYGLRFQAKNTEYINPTNRNRLIFGEIDGAATMDEDIIITWPDGSKNTIHYHCSDHVEWPEIDCKREWKLDGEKHDGNHFEFVKEHL